MKRSAAPLVLLDRDGVINRDSEEYIKSVAEWQPLPGSLEAIAQLTRAGFRVAVITNQSGIGRGLFDEQTLTEIHAAMRAAVTEAGGVIEGIYFCPHRPDDGCRCRKPKPGLLLDAIEDFSGSVEDAVFIGDKLSDVEAAEAAGVRPLLVGERENLAAERVVAFADLASAVETLIAEHAPFAGNVSLAEKKAR